MAPCTLLPERNSVHRKAEVVPGAHAGLRSSSARAPEKRGRWHSRRTAGRRRCSQVAVGAGAVLARATTCASDRSSNRGGSPV